MPVGVLALAGSLKQSGIKSEIYRPRTRLFDDASYDYVARELLALETPIIGFSTWCHSYPSSILLAKALKRLAPDRTILFGGPQATILDRETLSTFEWIDFVLRGEADFTITDCVRAIIEDSNAPEFGAIAGLTFRAHKGSDKLFRNESLPDIADLDLLPMPAYEFLSPNPGQPISLDVGRGCPFKCTFCTTSDFFSKSYRVKTVKRIVAEMEALRERFGVRLFDFTHDMFTLNKRLLVPFLEEMVAFRERCGGDLEWSCSARVDCVDDELIHLMGHAGCGGIFFGIESGSERIQRVIKKNLRLSKGYSVIDACRDNGIRTTTSFIAGFPEEERIDISASLTAAFEMTARGAKAQMSLLSLLPQTPLFERHRGQLSFDRKCSDFSGATLNQKERVLIAAYPDLFSSFYYLPVESVARDTLVALSALVNHLPDFRYTIERLWLARGDSIKQKNLLDEFEQLFLKLRQEPHPAIMVLSRWLESECGDRRVGNSMELQSLLMAETARAVVRLIFVTHQVLSPSAEFQEFSNKDLQTGEALLIVPYWCLITVPVELEQILDWSKRDWGGGRQTVQRKNCRYLIVATSERTSEVYRLSEQQYDFINGRSELQGLLNRIMSRDCDLDSWQETMLMKLSAAGVLKRKPKGNDSGSKVP